VFDLPLLAESSKWRKNLDKIIVVDCSVETQVSRVLTRDVQNNNRTTPMTRDLVINIIASQASRIDRLKLADVIILNDEITRQQLNDEIGQISEYLSLI
jgi:dephospho-CoA kinase